MAQKSAAVPVPVEVGAEGPLDAIVTEMDQYQETQTKRRAASVPRTLSDREKRVSSFPTYPCACSDSGKAANFC